MADLAAIPRTSESELPPRWPECNKVNNPLATPWQRKWLNLDCVRPEIQDLANNATAWAARWFRCETHPSLLVLVGNSGVGKTHTTKCLFRYTQRAAASAFDAGGWRKQFPNTGYFRWPEVCKGFEEKDYSAAQDMFGLGSVFIDDIGAERSSTPWFKDDAIDQLCQVLSRREFKFTVLTTNIDPMEWATRFDQRVSDRLLRNSTVVHLRGDSYSMQ